MTLLATPLHDPHCGRSSHADLEFIVAGQRWTARWGRYDAFGSPAYWVDQTIRGTYEPAPRSQREDLLGEIVFCLLGGFGVSAESAAAAHGAVMYAITDGHRSSAALAEVLRVPLPPRGRRYRFPRQRAERIANAISRFHESPPPPEPLALRSWLLDLAGVGPKTASWVVRNHTGSDDVAIIDIWLVRALTRAGVFPDSWRVDRDYGRYEEAFLSYADQGRVRASALDLCIWSQAREAGSWLVGDR
jgi:N-glycosylase/DNA lyase